MMDVIIIKSIDMCVCVFVNRLNGGLPQAWVERAAFSTYLFLLLTKNIFFISENTHTHTNRFSTTNQEKRERE